MIKSFEEADREIRALKDRLDALLRGEIDARQRRIVNLAPSKDPTDAVVRAELMQLFDKKAQQTTPTVTSNTSGSEEVCVFGAYLSSPIIDSQNICPPHIVKKAGRFKRVYAALREPFVDGVFYVRIRRNEEYITNLSNSSILVEFELTDKQDTYPVKKLDASDLTENSNWNLEEGDILTLDILLTNETYGGSGLIVKLVY